jgi:hypothetical protein
MRNSLKIPKEQPKKSWAGHSIPEVTQFQSGTGRLLALLHVPHSQKSMNRKHPEPISPQSAVSSLTSNSMYFMGVRNWWRVKLTNSTTIDTILRNLPTCCAQSRRQPHHEYWQHVTSGPIIGGGGYLLGPPSTSRSLNSEGWNGCFRYFLIVWIVFISLSDADSK